MMSSLILSHHAARFWQSIVSRSARALYRSSNLLKSNEVVTMPLVRINLSQHAPAALVQTVSEVVYDAMISVANVPPHDKFQIISRHGPDELVYPAEGYLGIEYSPGIIFIQVTWVGGRSVEVKQAFFRKIADDLHKQAGVRKQDVWISLVDVKREDWSFGNGEMQYAPT